jgi:hypothetical protein
VEFTINYYSLNITVLQCTYNLVITVQSDVRGREGRQGAAALHNCCAIAFLHVSMASTVIAWGNTPQYINITELDEIIVTCLGNTNSQVYCHIHKRKLPLYRVQNQIHPVHPFIFFFFKDAY